LRLGLAQEPLEHEFVEPSMQYGEMREALRSKTMLPCLEGEEVP